ncbi:hypothetical protein BU16DRAFT_441060, partial [Lophium mytilinum]
PPPCHHKFKIVVSEIGSAVVFECALCHSAPHWFIFKCEHCQIKTCRPCTYKA